MSIVSCVQQNQDSGDWEITVLEVFMFSVIQFVIGVLIADIGKP